MQVKDLANTLWKNEDILCSFDHDTVKYYTIVTHFYLNNGFIITYYYQVYTNVTRDVLAHYKC